MQLHRRLGSLNLTFFYKKIPNQGPYFHYITLILKCQGGDSGGIRTRDFLDENQTS